VADWEFAASTMRGVGVWWAVAGGWAVDLWLGEQTREHHDVEVVVKRQDQQAMRAGLVNEWELCSLDPPGSGWRPWGGEPIELPAFQLQARSPSSEFDIFLETSRDDVWRFRRDARIERPMSEFTTITGAGIPVVRPEVQLLYMAKSNEPKNTHDFAVTRPRLDDQAASWLARSLALAHPGHPWLTQL
jgi:aminoglycoside-2''-adenylyltransferase